MILHTVNKPLTSGDALARCVPLILDGASLLLIEDAVFNAVTGSPGERLLSEYQSTIMIYALQEDCQARGVLDRMPSYVTLVSYSEFVDLTVSHDKMISWS